MNKYIVLLFLVLYFVGVSLSLWMISNQEEQSCEIDKESGSSSHLNHKNKIAIIRIDAPITFGSQTNSLLGESRDAKVWLEQLDRAGNNPAIKALILRINSPGGSVGSTQELYEAILRVKKLGKPVIVSVADIATSGAYYIAAAADQIFTNPGSLLGSIGVIIGRGVEFSDLLNKLGINYRPVMSGKNKDTLSPYKAMTEDQYQLLEEMVLETHKQFVSAISQGRNKAVEDIEPFADGRVFTGAQAVKYGFADQIGTLYDAIEYTKITYNLKRATVVSIKVKTGPIQLQNIFSQAKTAFLDSFSLSQDILKNTPILYLYKF